MIAAKTLADSVSPAGRRITTFEATYPRFVHAELMTHRMFSRNTASSRAVPVERFAAQVRYSPVLPVWWGRNQKGMQAREELAGKELEGARLAWLTSAQSAAANALRLASKHLHKQLVNRVLEPFLWHTAIITATEWDQFWRQRCHPDAQPEMQALARAMLRAYLDSEPQPVDVGEWHMPFGDRMPGGATTEERLAIATGRCARISYTIFCKYPLVPLMRGLWPSVLKVLECATHFLETANHAAFKGAGLDHEGVPYVVAVEDEHETLRQRVFLQVVESGEEVGQAQHGAQHAGHFHAPKEPNTYGVFVLAVYGPEWLRSEGAGLPADGIAGNQG